MKKENIKGFWKKHKKTIKKTVILATMPVVVIGVYVVINKILDKKNNEIFDKLENNIR